MYLVLSVLGALGSMNEGKFCEEVAGDSWEKEIMAFMPPLSAHLGRKLPCFMDIGLGGKGKGGITVIGIFCENWMSMVIYIWTVKMKLKKVKVKS